MTTKLRAIERLGRDFQVDIVSVEDVEKRIRELLEQFDLDDLAKLYSHCATNHIAIVKDGDIYSYPYHAGEPVHMSLFWGEEEGECD